MYWRKYFQKPLEEKVINTESIKETELKEMMVVSIEKNRWKYPRCGTVLF